MMLSIVGDILSTVKGVQYGEEIPRVQRGGEIL